MKEKTLIKLERKIVIGMIIDTDFLTHIDKIIEIKWVQSKDARTLMTWVFDYFHSYKKAPGLKIQDIYEDKLDSNKIQESQAEVIEVILENLSEEVKDWDSEDIGFLKDQAEKYCNVCKLRGLSESVGDLLDSGDLGDAKQIAREYKPIQVMESKAVQPLKTDDQLNAIFTAKKKPLIEYPGALGQLINPQMQRQSFLVYLAQNKGGKALRNGKSPVLTNKGWKDISEMQIGDTIYNKQGKERKVTGIFPQGINTCYRFIFNDGIFIDSDKGHLWTLQTYRQRYQKTYDNFPNIQYKKWIEMSTKEIFDKFGEGKILSGSQRPIFPRNDSVNFRKKKVEMSPYVLGLLLGDGGFTGNYVGYTTNDYCTIEVIESFGYELTHTGFYGYRFKTKPENIYVKSHTDISGRFIKGHNRSLKEVNCKYRVKTLLGQYGLWGKLSHEKFIPDDFLLNTKENRLEILKGLMDTDGDVDKRGHLAFNSTSKQLINGVAFLVRSLGGKVTIKLRKPFYRKKGKKVYGKKSYRAFITLNEIIFKIPRKVKLQRIFKRTKERILYKIEKIGKYKTTCISTDDKDGLFITKDFIVTHNSFHLMDAAVRAATQGRKVLVYQAGDMTQVQLERRIAIYITKNSDQERYCGPLYIPVIDCQHNQLGTCEMDCRTNDNEGPFEEEGTDFLNEKVTFADLRQAFGEFTGHKVCQECRRSTKTISNFKGTVWYRKRPRIEPLQKHTYLEFIKKASKKFSTPYKALPNLRIATHSNESLNMATLEAGVVAIKEEEGFEADIVAADYLDLFMPDSDTAHLSFRDQENKKWQRARRISQDHNLLFLSASQSDADGFTKRLLEKSNFSEDRRKLDHVTGMLGLNMSIQEKMMGVMRINEIVSRETEGTGIVHVLHRLQIGRPVLGSYF